MVFAGVIFNGTGKIGSSDEIRESKKKKVTPVSP